MTISYYFFEKKSSYINVQLEIHFIYTISYNINLEIINYFIYIILFL